MTTPPLLTLLAGLYVLACLGSAGGRLLHWTGPLTSSGDSAAGDFLAHYTGAQLVQEGLGGALYDMNVQLDRQRQILGAGTPHLHMYVNPPLYALALAPLARCPLHGAFLLFSLAMLLCAAGGLWLLLARLPNLKALRVPCAMLALFFPPLIWSITGGQNTGLTVLLVAGCCSAAMSGRWTMAGCCAGLLSFKPQFMLPFLVLLAAGGRRRALVSAGLACVLHYGLGAVACGVDWPLDMLQRLGRYQELDQGSNLQTEVSLLGACMYACGRPGIPVGAAVSAALLAALWFMARRDRSEASPAMWGLAAAMAPLTSPHTQFYDVGVLVIPVLIGLHCQAIGGPLAAGARAVLLSGYLGFAVFHTAAHIGFQPLVLWPIFATLWMARLRAEERRRETAPPVGAAAPSSISTRPPQSNERRGLDHAFN
jgi:hypothetical protein